MRLGICDRGFWGFTLSYKLWLFGFDLGLGRTLMKFETSIMAGPSSGFGVKPKSNVCCLYSNQEYFDEQ
jgi:hypothetical protein